MATRIAPEKRTLQSETIKVISQITSTVLGIEYLLRPLSDAGSETPAYQLGPFVFFLQFVLCCLHRQDSMKEDKAKWVDEGWMTPPFYRNRHDQPSDGAAQLALDNSHRANPLSISSLASDAEAISQELSNPSIMKDCSPTKRP